MRPARRTSDVSGSLLSVEEVAFLSGTTVQVLSRITRLELVRPAKDEPELAFSPAVLPRLRKMLRVHRQLEVSWTSMALVLDLLDRVEELKTEVSRLRSSRRMGAGDGCAMPDA